MFYAKIDWNWPSGFGEEDFQISSIYFRYFVIISPGVALHLNKLKFPSSMEALCQVWLKFAHWLLRRRFLMFVNVLSLFRDYLPWKRTWPFIFTNLNPLHLRMLCAKFGWNSLSDSWEEDENVISLKTNGRRDGRRTTGDLKSSSFQVQVI